MSPHLDRGQGTPLVHLQSGEAPQWTPAHDLLARRFRVVALSVDRSSSPATVAGAIKNLGIDTFDLIAASETAATALALALEAPERVRALVLEAPPAVGDTGLEGRLQNVAVPTLVLFGTGDTAASPDVGRVYRQRIPNAHLVFVYAANRAISADRPEAFADVVADFVERHEAFVIRRDQTVIHP